MSEPKYPARQVPSVLDAYQDRIEAWLRTDSHRSRKERRSPRLLVKLLQAQGGVTSV